MVGINAEAGRYRYYACFWIINRDIVVILKKLLVKQTSLAALQLTRTRSPKKAQHGILGCIFQLLKPALDTENLAHCHCTKVYSCRPRTRTQCVLCTTQYIYMHDSYNTSVYTTDRKRAREKERLPNKGRTELSLVQCLRRLHC